MPRERLFGNPLPTLSAASSDESVRLFRGLHQHLFWHDRGILKTTELHRIVRENFESNFKKQKQA